MSFEEQVLTALGEIKQSINRLEVRVENIETRLDRIEAKVEIIERQTAENTAISRALEHKLENVNMNKEFGLLRAEINKKFQEIDDKFGGVYKVLGEHAVKLAM